MLPNSYSVHRTQDALTTFKNQQAGQTRVLLKVVEDGKGGRHLEAKTDSWLNWFDRIFHRTSYRLESVVAFLNSNDFAFELEKKTDVKAALKKLDVKIDKHNTSYFKHLFNRVIDPKPNLDSLYRTRVESAKISEQINTVIEQLYFPFSAIEELEPLAKTLDEIKSGPEHAIQMKLARTIFEQKMAIAKKKRQENEAPLEITLAHIVPQKSDGNCLLRSFAWGLHHNREFPADLLKKYKSPEKAHAHFRNEASTYIENHLADDQIQTLLTEAISEHNDSEKAKYEMEKTSLLAMLEMDEIDPREVHRHLQELEDRYEATKIADGDFRTYLEFSRQESFFCSTVHLYALSQHYNVNIKVFHKTGDSLTEMPAVPLLETPKATISLYFNPNGPHYDAIAA